MREEWKTVFQGRAFYAALVVCLAAAVVGGGLMVMNSRPVTAPRSDAVQSAVQPPEEQMVLMPEILVEDEVEEAAGPAELAEETEEATTPEGVTQEAEEAVQSAAAPAPMPAAAVIGEAPPVKPQPPQAVVAPLEGEVVAAFSVDALVYSPTMEDWRTHDGVDIAAQPGTAVLSAGAGTVVAVEQDAMMGTVVVIDHGDGCQTTYANLQTQPGVKVGQRVNAGQTIGAVGESGAAESALEPHLHFSVTKDGDVVDPAAYLN